MQHSASITIERPVRDVWSAVGDPRAWHTWLAGVRAVEVENSGVLAQGAKLSYTWRGRPVKASLARYEEGRVTGIHSSEKNYEFNEAISLHEMGGQTEVTFAIGFEPTLWWMSASAVALLPLKGLLLGRPLKKELRSLKRALEAHPA